MKKLILFSVALSVAISTRALPVYDNFSTYGAPGTWTETTPGPPIVSYTTGAPLLGGTTAPSGESWIVYTNAPVPILYVNYYAGDFTGYDSQNVAVVNYFASGQPGASDSASSLTLPPGFAGPFVPGHDTSANSLWTPGYSQANEVSPPIQPYLGGVGACLQFSSPVSGNGNKVFASFFVDVPDTTASFGAGQSSPHGYSAGFLPSSEIPSPNSTVNQNALPGVSSSAPPAGFSADYTTFAPIFEKFNVRAVAGTPQTWRPGVYDTDANTASVGGGPYAAKSIHFIVISYEFNGGATLDVERVWIDPQASVFGASTEPITGLGAGSTTSHSPATGNNLPNADGFFFLANTQDGGATPNSGILFNSLSIGTSWAYVTGGAQFTANEPYAVGSAGQTLVLHPTAAAGGGVSCTYAWANSSGPLTGGRFSVNPTTGALTIANVQASDADTYTVSVSTPITTENSVAPITAQTLVAVFTSENASAIGSGQFTLNFTGPVGAAYRIWSTTDLTQTPVLTTWNLVTSGNFIVGPNSYTDNAAAGQARYYTITIP